MKNRMEVYLDGEGYMSREPGNQELIDLFGTDTIPLPFLKGYDEKLIISTLQQLNPDKEIVIVSK